MVAIASVRASAVVVTTIVNGGTCRAVAMAPVAMVSHVAASVVVVMAIVATVPAVEHAEV